MGKKRSVGVKVIGIINFIFLGLIALSSSLNKLLKTINLQEGYILFSGKWDLVIPLYRQHYKPLLIFSFVVSLLYMLSGYGLLKLNNKARKVTIGLAFGITLWFIFSYIFLPYELELRFLMKGGPIFSAIKKSELYNCFLHPFHFFWLVLRYLYQIFLIYFFTRPKVKEQFKIENKK